MTIPPIIQGTPLPPSPPQRPEPPHAMFSALAIAASGLTAQRVRMDVVAQNLANAETTKTPGGGPYQRRTVSLEAVVPDAMTSMTSSSPTTVTTGAQGAVAAPGAVPAPGAVQMPPVAYGSTPIEMTNDVGGVRVAGVGVDKSDGAMVYNPGSPDADKNGYVRMPNVNITDEMIDLMNARRIYDANATVFQVARAMLAKAIDI
ncbi:MAG: flagellar basal body rod protein FlgC [Gemmatimonadaceae bacterium]